MDERIKNELDLIKESVLKTVPAESIYLFGSYAYGTQSENSDLDIYVVVPDSIQTHPLDIGAEIRARLYKKRTIPMDLLVGKSSVFNRRKQSLTLENTIMQDGVLLYET